MCILVLELSDHGNDGRIPSLGLESGLSPARIRRQDRTIPNARVGLERGTLNNNVFLKELNHLNVKLTALRAFGTVERIMTLTTFMAKMAKK